MDFADEEFWLVFFPSDGPLFSRIRLTYRKLSEAYSSNWSQNFIPRVSPIPHSFRKCWWLWVLQFSQQLQHLSLRFFRFESFFSAFCSVVGTDTHLLLYIPIVFRKIDIREDANTHKVISYKYLSNMEFCGNSTGVNELIVDGLLANVRIGIVFLFCLSSLLRKESPTLQLEELILVLFVVRQSEFLKEDLGVNQTWKNDYQKRFPVIPMYSMCSGAGVCRGSAQNENLESRLVDWKRKTISNRIVVTAGRLETCDSLPLWFDSTSGNSPESFTEFICSCISCICEVSFCIVSWLSLNFCTENSSTRNSWALFISPISWKFRIWVSRSFVPSEMIDSSSGRGCSLRDSIYPCWASSNSNLSAKVCCWSSLMHLLRDSTWSSCFTISDLAWLSKWSLFASRRDLPRFDGSAFLKIELLIRFHRSSLPDENIAARFPDSLGSWDELDIKLSLRSAWVRLDDLQSSRPCTYSGEASIFRCSPSSRSESAMLSAES